VHRIAITQWRGVGPGRDYMLRRIQRGDTKTSAIRALRRHLSDEVFRRLRLDQQQQVSASTTQPAIAA